MARSEPSMERMPPLLAVCLRLNSLKPASKISAEPVFFLLESESNSLFKSTPDQKCSSNFFAWFWALAKIRPLEKIINQDHTEARIKIIITTFTGIEALMMIS